VPVLTTKFVAPKMYVYPIPYDEVQKNPNMKQNPGW
jgi:starch-binding outer membrane protein, SusD/RagB family